MLGCIKHGRLLSGIKHGRPLSCIKHGRPLGCIKHGKLLSGIKHDLNPTEVAKPTNKSIAREIEKSQAETHIMRQVANHLDDPDVAKAKDAREAQKIIQRKAKEEHIKKRAAAVSLASIAHDFENLIFLKLEYLILLTINMEAKKLAAKSSNLHASRAP